MDASGSCYNSREEKKSKSKREQETLLSLSLSLSLSKYQKKTRSTLTKGIVHFSCLSHLWQPILSIEMTVSTILYLAAWNICLPFFNMHV